MAPMGISEYAEVLCRLQMCALTRQLFKHKTETTEKEEIADAFITRVKTKGNDGKIQ